MKKAELTVAEALKFARHDFLNELQLVLMYIDLGEVTQAKQAIQNATEEIRQLSKLENLGLPSTVRWISTFGWMYTAFDTKLSCTIETGFRKADDLEVANYLISLFTEIVGQLDAMSEYEAHINVHASPSDWTIDIIISGGLDRKQQLPETGKHFLVEETVLNKLWKFKMSGN